MKGLSGLVVIVVGVLLALVAESAWAERGDRAREQEILVDLLDEFGENEARLLSDIESNAAATAAEEAWVAAMLGTETISSDSMSALFFTSRWGARFDPITGALRSVLDGGELGLIRDNDLRAAVAGWLDRAEEARVTSSEITNMRANLAPLLVSFERGEPLTPGMRAAIQYDAAMTDGNEHLLPLLNSLRELVTLLESRLDR